jgi:VWFA-related protein
MLALPRALLPFLLACASQAFAQSQTLIKLNVVATDAKGTPITDLRATDLQIREDGKPRQVVFFRFGGNKGSIAQPAMNEFVNRPSPPLTLILLDRWNERELTMASAWQDVDSAVGRLETVDRLCIYFLANHGELLPVRALPGAESNLRPAAPPTTAAIVAKLNDTVRTLSGLRDVANFDPVFRANTTLQALGIISQMAAFAGPKNLIWVTHGFPINVIDLTNQWVDFTGSLLALAQASVNAQVAIYTVDQSAQGAGADLAGFSDALSGSSSDARCRYQIAYYAPVHGGGSKEHKIRLDSARKGIRLLTRASYFGYQAMPDADEMAEDAFNSESHSPFEATEVGLRVAMSPKTSGVHLDIHVDPADVLLEHSGDRFQGSLSLAFALYHDGEFQSAAPALRQDINLTQEQYDDALKNGIVIPRDVNLASEVQQVRVMVFDRGARGLGSATVPAK